MGIEGFKRASNPEDPFGKGIEANGPFGIELTALNENAQFNDKNQLSAAPSPNSETDQENAGPLKSCILAIPFRSPRRFGGGRTELTITNVPVIEGDYRGFRAAMEIAGFVEYSDKGKVRFTTIEGEQRNISTPGDFQMIEDFPPDALQSGVIRISKITAEEHLMSSVLGWGRYLVLSGRADQEIKRLTVVDLVYKMSDVLQQYPLERIVVNPFSPYLPT